MSPEPGPFEAFYASPLQHPILLWLAAGAALVFCATRRGLAPSLRRYCFALAALSLADAWLTANQVFGLGALPGWAGRAVPLLFVLAGDFRFLLLLGAATARGGIEPSARRVLAAAGLTLVVPIGSQALVGALPEALAAQPRVLFLSYELGFVLLTLALVRWHPGARSVPWLAPVCRFVLLYYGGLIAAIARAGERAQAGPGSARKSATAAFQAPGSSK